MKSESKITSKFLAVCLILLENGPRLMGLVMVVGRLKSSISDFELLSWRKIGAVLKQQPGFSDRLDSAGDIFVSSA